MSEEQDPSQQDSQDQEADFDEKEVDRLSDDQLKSFIIDFVSGRIFTDLEISHVTGNNSLMTMIFMPLGFGAISDWSKDRIASIGRIYEYFDAAGPRAVNGFPMFTSVRFLHKEDWERVLPAIEKEAKRRSEIEI